MRSGSSSRFWRAATSHRSQAWPAQCRQVQKLRKRHPFPRCDLIGMNVERSASQSYRPVALDGGKRHLRVEGRCVVPARSSVHGLSVDSVFSAFRQKSHLSEPALYTCVWPDCFHPAAVFGKRTPRRQKWNGRCLNLWQQPSIEMAHLDPLYDRLEFIEGRRCVASVERRANLGRLDHWCRRMDVRGTRRRCSPKSSSPRLLELGTFFISG